MKANIKDLTGGQLDWAVGQAAGMQGLYIAKHSYLKTLYCAKGLDFCGTEWLFDPSTNWVHGGPIIEQEKICLEYSWFYGELGQGWEARDNRAGYARGNTPLIAAMKCYIRSKLGDEVEIPEEVK